MAYFPKFCRGWLLHAVVIILRSVCWDGLNVEGFNYSDYRVLSATEYPEIRVQYYDWRYIRVELPNGFSTLSVNLTTDWPSVKRDLFDLSNNTIPIICIRSGGPPLPDSVVDSDLIEALSTGSAHNMSNMGYCAWFRESMRINLTDEQVSSGIVYLGFFNGVGPVRTQSKMISRGSAYTVGVEIVILGCKSSFLGGLYCNNTVNYLSCPWVELYDHSRQLYENPPNGRELKQIEDFYPVGRDIGKQIGHMGGNCFLEYKEHDDIRSRKISVSGDRKKCERISVSGDRSKLEKRYRLSESVEYELVCSNSQGKECIKSGEWKFFALQVVDTSSQLEITVEYENLNLATNGTDNTNNGSNVTIKQTEVEAAIYVRHNALPQKTLYEYSLSVGQSALNIQFPKLGWWYIGAYFSNVSKTRKEEDQEKKDATLCFVLTWKIYACSFGKSGDGCRWNVDTLKRVKQVRANLPFESHYLPTNQEETIESESFMFEPFFSNYSKVASQHEWTFFLFEVPHGAAGGVINVELKSYSSLSFDIYARFGGLPTLHVWDYHTNVSNTAESSMLATVKDANSKAKMFLNIIYPQEGIWCLGLRHSSDQNLKLDNHEVAMSISLQSCPNHCSKHGNCHNKYEESGLTSFSYCYCDRTHGGFDCSIELISPKGHRVQAAALIVSNIAAILPGLWSIRHKAYAEWILYTTSGISSALYHSCDAGSWCVLSFHVLQFMDFWLSFMAVAATFIFMASMDDKTKVAVHASVAIITALIAVNGPTRSINIILVVIIGTTGLLFGWAVEFYRSDQITICRAYFFNSTIRERWQAMRTGLKKLIKNLRQRFHWHFMGLGFLALGAAGLSWHLEAVRTYWIWHSLWHLSIYTASFFFLCSTVSEREPSRAQISYEPISYEVSNNSIENDTRHAELANPRV